MAQKIGALIKDRAFLLRSVDYGDDHRILHWLSANHGRVHLMAYAARSSRRRSFQSIDYLRNFQIEYQPGSGLGRLLQCEPLESFDKIGLDYSKTLVALNWIKLLSRILHEGIAVHGVFDLLAESFRALEVGDSARIDLAYRYLLIAKLGYRLNLARCLRCASSVSIRFEFHLSDGGLLCASCGDNSMRVETSLSQVVPETVWDLKTGSSCSTLELPKIQRILKNAFEELLGYSED